MNRTVRWSALALLLVIVLFATLPQTVAARRWVFDLLPLIVLLACLLFHLVGHAHHRRAPRPSVPLLRTARDKRMLVLFSLASLAWAPSAAAQEGEADTADVGIRRVVHAQLGAYLPLGALRDGFGPTMLVGVQGFQRLGPVFGLVASVSGAQVRDLRPLSRPEWYLWQYDVGLEAATGHGGRLRHPALFAGAGLGGRTYDRAGAARGARSAAAAYASLGAEVRARRTGLRVESRVYVSRPGGQPDGSAIRADAAVSVGLAYHVR